MTGPPAAERARTDPGGLQAPADGQQVEVRTFEGDLIRIVPLAVADDLVQKGLVDDLRHCLRLKLGIQWLSPRLDRASGRPDLKQMQRRQPERYAALWRRKLDAKTGRGALGRRTIDNTVRYPSTEKGSNRT